MSNKFAFILILSILSGCDAGAGSSTSPPLDEAFQQIAMINSPVLDEISGIQSGADGDFFVHNDEGKARLHVIDLDGRHVSTMGIRDAKNRDWEDITRIRRGDERLIVLGDTGDNKTRYKTIRLYFVMEPRRDEQGAYPEKLDLMHKLKARYPDGARDCEAMAYDPSSDRILFLSKRDKIPRLYGLQVDKALSMKEAELDFLAEVSTFRPPSTEDIMRSGKRARWISQPTGMDISEDGKEAAVITYRSLYHWTREDDESWAEAFQKTPSEFMGPPGYHDEAVTFGPDPDEVFVTSEGVPTPLYRLQVP